MFTAADYFDLLDELLAAGLGAEAVAFRAAWAAWERNEEGDPADIIAAFDKASEAVTKAAH